MGNAQAAKYDPSKPDTAADLLALAAASVRKAQVPF
jgi:hypothetical protein